MYLQVAGEQVLLHRFLQPPAENLKVDHINGDILDNRKKNLRCVTTAQNSRNVEGPQRNGRSGFLGVCYDKCKTRKPWKAHIQADGRSRSLGYHATPEEAHLARLRAELDLWGPQPRRLQMYIDAGLVPC